MKGLLKYLSPFAPDQSGAVSVLFPFGGITVVCDAGGCAGNICGFDEPRWGVRSSAIFSAGLRDMDAILGRDDVLVSKLKQVSDKMEASFAALVGTPVPAVIATDFTALKRMAEAQCGLPVITVPCTGTRLYDEGSSDAWLALFQEFTDPSEKPQEGRAGVIGLTPLEADLSMEEAGAAMREFGRTQGYDSVVVYGEEGGLQALQHAGSASLNYVVSPSGIRAAEYLKETFGTPYRIVYPLLRGEFREKLTGMEGKRVLVVHQQVASEAVRQDLLAAGASDVVCATWFLQESSLTRPEDLLLETEGQFCELCRDGDFDVIIADPVMKRAATGFEGTFLSFPHYAVSGECGHDGE